MSTDVGNRHSRDERGLAVSVWVALIVPLVMLFMGIAVDLSGQVGAIREADAVAAQAARVAGQQIDADAYMADGRKVRVDPARARAAARRYIESSGMTGNVRIESTSRLMVTTTATYRPRFLSILGVGGLQVHGEAFVTIIRTLDGQERR
ncbi:MAG: pilus assembly protein [Micropruina sp.]|uniref:pilus assembly protein n=1 Tax=Micropruina sp. TaxID=2737536 RepID=UPI0039E5AF79